LTNEQPDRIDPCEVIPPNNDNHTPPTNSDTRPPGGAAELVAVAAEVSDAAADVDGLEARLADARRVYADLVAACRAALTAHADGEADPLSYVRDELPAAPPGHPLSTCQRALDRGAVDGTLRGGGR
jgi:hypothetical protein